MQIRRIALSAALATTMAAVPLSAAKAQYYNPMCNPFPLTWPFCIVGAAVGTAATIASVPFRAVGAAPYYYPYGPYYYGYGYYGAPYYPPNYGPRYSGR